MAEDYTTVDLVKKTLDIELADTTDDLLIGKAITAASRSIERWTGTKFYTVTEARYFTANTKGVVELDRILDVTGMVIKTGAGGAFPTTVDASAYVLQPFNAPARGEPYEKLVLVGGAADAAPYPNVEITATWGYDEVPADVELACRIKAIRLFRRKDLTEGAGGTSEFGVVQMSPVEDADVLNLLEPFCDPTI